MSIQTASAEHFFVVRWGKPDTEDFDRIVGEVTALRAQLDRDVLYLAIMPEEMPNVDSADAKRLKQLVEDLLPSCAMVCVAMEMRGFRNAIIRSAMTAVTLVTRRHDKLRFVESVQAALDASTDHHLADREAMAKAISDTGSPVPAEFAA